MVERGRRASDAVAGTTAWLELFDRQDELRAVEDFLTDISAGRASVLALHGPAGIGKTQLLSALCEQAEGCGASVWRASGGELERELGLGVVRQLFASQPIAPAAPDELDLTSLVTSASVAPRAEWSLFEALLTECGQCAADAPLLLVLDDAHWADPESLRFLNFAARRIRGTRIGLVLGVRDGAPTVRELDLLVTSADRSLTPHPLSAAAVSALVARHYPGGATDTFCRAVHELTGGNPLLVRELLTDASLRGLSPDERSVSDLSTLGSRSVAETVLSRVLGGGPAAVAVSRAASVLGRHTTVRTVAELAGISEDEAESAVNTLVDAQVLDHGYPLRFRHPLLFSAVYQHMPTALRSRLHANAARLLAAEVSDEDVCQHLLLTEPRRDPWVVRTLARAARAAMARGLTDTAVTYWRRALAEPPERKRSLVLMGLAYAEMISGRGGAYAHAREALQTASDERTRAWSGLLYSLLQGRRGEWSDALHTLEEVLAGAPGLDPELAIRLKAQWLWAADGADMDAAVLLARAEEVAEGLTGVSAGAREVLVHLASARLKTGAPLGRVRPLAEAALADGKMLAEHTSASPLWMTAVGLAWLCGSVEVAAVELERGEVDARQHGSTAGELMVLSNRAQLRLVLGDLPGAESDARVALGMRPLRDPRTPARRFPASVLAMALAWQGRAGAAREVLAEFELVAEPAGLLDLMVRRARAAVHDALGQPADAAEDWLAIGRWCEAHGVRNPMLWPWRSLASIRLAATGDRERATALAAEELALARSCAAPRAIGQALYASARLAGGEQRRAWLEESVDVLSRTPFRLERAHALLDLGTCQRQQGALDLARRNLSEGRLLAEACGATPDVERADRELALTTPRPRTAAVTGPASLTLAERLVCDLAAAGESNRAIADKLMVSTKTVEKHLSSSYAKLQLTSRADLHECLAHD